MGQVIESPVAVERLGSVESYVQRPREEPRKKIINIDNNHLQYYKLS